MGEDGNEDGLLRDTHRQLEANKKKNTTLFCDSQVGEGQAYFCVKAPVCARHPTKGAFSPLACSYAIPVRASVFVRNTRKGLGEQGNSGLSFSNAVLKIDFFLSKVPPLGGRGRVMDSWNGSPML